jgi:hypothetical protein
LPSKQLTEFDRTPGISRVYDNGTIRIYALGATAGGPTDGATL